MTWSEVTFGPVAGRNTHRGFASPHAFSDDEGGVDFRFKVTSDITNDNGFWIESVTPIAITSGDENP